MLRRSFTPLRCHEARERDICSFLPHELEQVLRLVLFQHNIVAQRAKTFYGRIALDTVIITSFSLGRARHGARLDVRVLR